MTVDKKGLISALLAYLSWGFFPIYWKLLQGFPSLEILFHRIIWSAVFYGICLTILYWRDLRTSLLTAKRDVWLIIVASLLISVNWLSYIYAVNSGHVLQGSLAYFMNPILNVVFGALMFKEKLGKFTKIAFLFAAAGVLTISVLEGEIPWLAILMAVTFAAYGICKKLIKARPWTASLYETLVVFLPALVGAVVMRSQATSAATPTDWLLLVLSGVVTGLPLIWFATAAQRLSLSTMGFLQFLSPSLQFLSGVFLFNEAFSLGKAAGFALIWCGVLFFIGEFRYSSRQ